MNVKATLTFSSTINQWLQTLWILRVDHPNKGGINPASGLDAVQPTDDNLKLHVIVFILILDLAHVRCDIDSLHPLLHKGSSNFSLGLANVSLAEEKLSVQV